MLQPLFLSDKAIPVCISVTTHRMLVTFPQQRWYSGDGFISGDDCITDCFRTCHFSPCQISTLPVVASLNSQSCIYSCTRMINIFIMQGQWYLLLYRDSTNLTFTNCCSLELVKISGNVQFECLYAMHFACSFNWLASLCSSMNTNGSWNTIKAKYSLFFLPHKLAPSLHNPNPRARK